MARVVRSHSVRRAGAIALLALGVSVLPPGNGPVAAGEYRFEADYSVLFNGLPVGRATLMGQFDGAKYRLDGQGKLTGLAGAIFDYKARAAAAGRIRAGHARPSAFSADSSDGKESESVRMTLSGSSVNRLSIDPPLKPHQLNHPARVKITEAHRRGVIDPMSALIAPGGFDGENFDRSVCNRSVPIFNGRERFDVNLEYKGIQTVTSNSSDGYSGPVLVCSARYRPVAGHRSDKDEIKYVANKVVVEVMLAPVAGSDLLVPYRATVSTPLGAGAVQATKLVANGTLNSRSAALSD